MSFCHRGDELVSRRYFFPLQGFTAIICCKLAVPGVGSQLAQIPIETYVAIAEDIAYAPISTRVHERQECDEGSNKKLRCMCTR